MKFYITVTVFLLITSISLETQADQRYFYGPIYNRVSVDCKEHNSKKTYYLIPGNCKVISHLSEWISDYDLKIISTYSEIKENIVIAMGSVRGLDKSDIACKSHGHASLHLDGEIECIKTMLEGLTGLWLNLNYRLFEIISKGVCTHSSYLLTLRIDEDLPCTPSTAGLENLERLNRFWVTLNYEYFAIIDSKDKIDSESEDKVDSIFIEILMKTFFYES